MFGETEYDPIQQYSSIPIEEQLGALGEAVDAGKVISNKDESRVWSLQLTFVNF